MDVAVEPSNRDRIPEESKWDLSGLYREAAPWRADFTELEAQVSNYEPLRGSLGRSPDALKACLEFDAEVMRKLEALYTFAHLRNDEDKTDNVHQQNYEKVVGLHSRIMQARSFIAAETMEIPEDKMREFLESRELESYRLHLERMLRFRDHILSQKEEALLASASEMGRAAQDAFGMLDNADMDYGTVKDEEGRDVAITHGNLSSLFQKYDRRVRKETFETFYAAYKNHRYTYAALLSGSVKKDLFFSRARNHASTREQALFDENIPVEVYDNLIGAVHDNLEPLRKYFRIRKKILGLDELRIYDCSVPLVEDFKWNLTYEEAVPKILAALEPLGSEYAAVLKEGLLEKRWVDRYENKGKRSGAYSSGCYDSQPFILMNYRDDDINSLYTLAHEAGHSMHSHFSRSHQPYLYADYTIFVAEVASTFNETLITRYLLSQNPDRDMKIYLTCREIDSFRGTLYRQTMFAEFEQIVHAAAKDNQPLTADVFCEQYRKLIELYFGAEVVLDDALSLECFRIPHFYFSFYVYKYATGISAAYALADLVLSGGEDALGKYLDFLKSGGSKYPIDLLKDAGIDMTSPEPIGTALKKFAELVDQLETLTS